MKIELHKDEHGTVKIHLDDRIVHGYNPRDLFMITNKKDPELTFSNTSHLIAEKTVGKLYSLSTKEQVILQNLLQIDMMSRYNGKG